MNYEAYEKTGRMLDKNLWLIHRRVDKPGWRTNQTDLCRPSKLGWIIIGITAIVRTSLLWAYFVYVLAADDKGTYNMDAINAMGHRVFPEFFLSDLITAHFNMLRDAFTSLTTILVFISTLLLGLLLRLMFSTGYSYYLSRNQAT